MWDRIIHWLEQHLSTCPYNKILGMECPGCGMQRSFVALLKGNMVESIQLYPATIPLLLLFFLLLLHLKFQFRWGAQVLKCLFFLCVGIIIFSYIYKIIT